MINVNVDIKPEDINQMVSSAVLKSALGDAIKKQIDEAIAGLNKSWDNPLKKTVDTFVNNIVHEILVREHKDTIAQIVREQITQDTIQKICQKAWDKLTD